MASSQNWTNDSNNNIHNGNDNDNDNENENGTSVGLGSAATGQTSTSDRHKPSNHAGHAAPTKAGSQIDSGGGAAARPDSGEHLCSGGGLSVRSALEWHQDPVEDYKMSSPTRGYCLIINNVEFSLGLFEYRKGSDKDAHRFKEIFKQLGFEVDCKRNASAEKMNNAFKQKSTLCSRRHDALVVILLSHGTESGVYGSDGIEVEMNDILSYFDNKKCKAMQNKPKVFIVQACRGRRADYGVQHETQTFFSQPDTQLSSTLPSQLTQLNSSQVSRLPRWAEVDQNSNPTRTDMILCFASHSGFVSTRDEDEGSWLGSALARHLSREAHRRHLVEIFNMVSREVRQRRSCDGLKQVLEITSIGFDKNLYFNPGLSATVTMTAHGAGSAATTAASTATSANTGATSAMATRSSLSRSPRAVRNK